MSDDQVTRITHAEAPQADADFCEIFMPYEIRLAQRRTMVEQTLGLPELTRSSLGLYLIHVEPPGWAAESTDHGVRDNIDRHVHTCAYP